MLIICAYKKIWNALFENKKENIAVRIWCLLNIYFPQAKFHKIRIFCWIAWVTLVYTRVLLTREVTCCKDTSYYCIVIDSRIQERTHMVMIKCLPQNFTFFLLFWSVLLYHITSSLKICGPYYWLRSRCNTLFFS